MPDDKSVSEILSSAKDTLKSAEAFSKSATGGDSTPTPKHEYSNAPYSLVRSKSTNPSIGDELKTKKEMVDKARTALK
jgi:hypothetical protein